MTPKNKKPSKPSAAEIYASAWAALEADYRVYSEAELEADGWRSSYSFSDDSARAVYLRLYRDKSVEKKNFKVRRRGQTRSVTFFRPRV